jgi:hypothetical protein
MNILFRTAALATLALAGVLAGCNRDAGSGATGASTTPAPVTPPAATVPDTSVPPASAASR